MVALGQRSCLNAEGILTLLGSFSRRIMGFQHPMSRKPLATANKHPPPREGAGGDPFSLVLCGWDSSGQRPGDRTLRQSEWYGYPYPPLKAGWRLNPVAAIKICKNFEGDGGWR